MKKMKYSFITFLFLGMLFFSNVTVHAKELEVCRLCHGGGDYHCSWCNNAGTVVCDGCGGAGGSKCQGDTYKGNSCDNGYYVVWFVVPETLRGGIPVKDVETME